MSTSFDMIGVVAADGHTLSHGHDATGLTLVTVPPGGTAQVLLSQIPGLMQRGAIAARAQPTDRSDNVDWVAWSLYTTIRSAVAAAAKLNARDSDFRHLVWLLVGYSTNISKYASQLLTALNEGSGAQAQVSLGPAVPSPVAGIVHVVQDGWAPDPADDSTESLVESRYRPVGLAAYREGALGRLPWRLLATARGAEGIATVLRPGDPVAAQLAQHLVSYSTDISNYVTQLRTAIDGETGGAT